MDVLVKCVAWQFQTVTPVNFIIFVSDIPKSKHRNTMKQFFRFIQVAILFVCTVTLSGQRPGPSYGPGFIKWIDDNRMLIRMYDEEKQPTERIEKNLVTVEYNCRTGKSVRVAEYRTEMQQLSDLLPEGGLQVLTWLYPQTGSQL